MLDAARGQGSRRIPLCERNEAWQHSSKACMPIYRERERTGQGVSALESRARARKARSNAQGSSGRSSSLGADRPASPKKYSCRMALRCRPKPLRRVPFSKAPCAARRTSRSPILSSAPSFLQRAETCAVRAKASRSAADQTGYAIDVVRGQLVNARARVPPSTLNLSPVSI